MKDFKRVMHYLEGKKGLAVLALLFALISVFSKMAIPYVAGLAIQKTIDSFSLGQQPDLSLYLIVLAIFLASGFLFRYLFEFLTSYIGEIVVKKMRDLVYLSFNESPIKRMDKTQRGDLILALVGDIENIKTGLISGAGALFEGVVQIAITIVFMFMINWVMAIATIVLTPLSIVISRFVAKRNATSHKEQNQVTADLTAYSLESLSNLATSKSYGLEEKKAEGFEKVNRSLKEANFKASFGDGLINPSTRLVNNIVYAVLTFLGALLIIKKPGLGLESFGPGALSSMLSYAFQYMAPFNEISNVASEVSYAFASFKRVDKVINAEKDIDEGDKLLNEEIESIKAKDITFAYDGKRDVIKGFNLEISKGKKIALVGPTGCGKTTIINLILRFYDPQKGGFFINDMPSSSFKKEEIRKHLGMVLQDGWLFHGSIKDNIAYAKKDASFEEVIAASVEAKADSFIRKLPKGYDTIVSNNSGLSAGQKQLISLARIMLLKPEVIILDEATSNIDLRTELLLAESFDKLMEGKTSIVVAHRLSTIKNADEIVVMKNGEIVQTGTFEELLDKGGFFKEIYDSQFA